MTLPRQRNRFLVLRARALCLRLCSKFACLVAVRLGYMGHINLISNAMLKALANELVVNDGLTDGTLQEWQEYVQGPLAQRNETNNTPLGKASPKASGRLPLSWGCA